MAALGLHGRTNIRLQSIYFPSRLFFPRCQNQFKSFSVLSAHQNKKRVLSPSIGNRMYRNATNGANGTKIPIAGVCQARTIQAYHSDLSQQMPGEVETEFLIVGAGPAGASLACFLASYGKLYIAVRLCRILTR